MPLSPPAPPRIRPSRIINFFLLLLIITAAACAKNTVPPLEASFFKKDITIVDIRTEAEWQQTGIIAGSKTITFFDGNGNYNEADFIKQLDRVVDKNEEFAVICRSGRRSRIVAQLLSKKGYKVIDLKSGINNLPAAVKLVPYK